MKDILSAAGLMVLAAYVYVASGTIVSKTNMDIGPDFMPRLIAILIFCLSAILLIGTIRARKLQPDGTAGEIHGRAGLVGLVDRCSDWLSIALIIAYGLAFSTIGFVLSTMFYIFLQGLLLSRPGKRRLVAIAITAVTVPPVCNFVFVRLMHVFLPAGWLG